MKKLGTALLSASALLVAGTAAAELPEWTYGQVGYFQADSFGDDQTDGLTINGSVGFLDVWHIEAGYIDGSTAGASNLLGAVIAAELEAELGADLSSDFDGWSVTVGAHPAINEKSQLVINATYFDTSYDVDGGEGAAIGDIDRDGYGFGVGIRTNVTDKVEASAIGYWTDASFDDAGSDADATNISVVLAGRYNWTENFSTGATVTISDPTTGLLDGASNSMNLDVRYTFAGLRL